MNLKDWEALSDEDKEKILRSQRIALPPLPISPQTRCCSIRDIFLKWVKDEQDGAEFYSLMAKQVRDIGYPDLADAVHVMAGEELRHKLEIYGIAKTLSDGCGCKPAGDDGGEK
ncbi:MAG: ferritin family protein [Dehalococcoidia bacterium]|jgi:hypothetical protein